MKIVTNNPKVRDQITNREIKFVDGTYRDVLDDTRMEIIDNHQVLLTHPLSGSIKPNETFYKSIIITDQKIKAVDMDSLEMIESALEVHDKFEKNGARPQWTAKILEDFALIDYDLIDSALSRIQVTPTYL